MWSTATFGLVREGPEHAGAPRATDRRAGAAPDRRGTRRRPRRSVSTPRVAAHGDVLVVAAEPEDRGREPQAAAERRDQSLDVARAAALDDRHIGRSRIRSRPWLAKKAITNAIGKSRNGAGRARPDRRAHRQQVVIAKARGRSRGRSRKPPTESPPDRAAWSAPSRLNRRTSRSMPRNAGLTRCRRSANRPSSEVPLYSRPVRSQRTLKLISRGAGGDAEAVEQAREERIGAVVEDDEAGVDGDGAVRRRRTSTVWVWPPGVVVGLEHRHLVAACEQEGRHQTGHAAADDRDSHHPHASGRLSRRVKEMSWTKHGHGHDATESLLCAVVSRLALPHRRRRRAHRPHRRHAPGVGAPLRRGGARHATSGAASTATPTCGGCSSSPRRSPADTPSAGWHASTTPRWPRCSTGRARSPGAALPADPSATPRRGRRTRRPASTRAARWPPPSAACSPRCGASTPPKSSAKSAGVAAALPPRELVHAWVLPLMRHTGAEWHAGRLSTAQEHLLSASLRSLLGGIIRVMPQAPTPPQPAHDHAAT